MFRGNGMFSRRLREGAGLCGAVRGEGEVEGDVWSVVPCKRQERSASE